MIITDDIVTRNWRERLKNKKKDMVELLLHYQACFDEHKAHVDTYILDR